MIREFIKLLNLNKQYGKSPNLLILENDRIMITRYSSHMRISCIYLILLTLVVACGPPPDESEAEAIRPDMHNSMISLDWAGTYHGVIPCADCEGIDARITLTNDLAYQMEWIYKGKSEDIYRNQGTITWSEAGSRIRLNNIKYPDTLGHYQVGENQLFQLDRSGNRIEGSLANHYILYKIIDNLSGFQWELIELNGRKVKLKSESLQNPTLFFSKDEKSVSGSGSCNRFNGNYEIKSGNKITFNNIASTRMWCENMEIERIFFESLERAGHYSLYHDTLSISNSNQRYLARFTLKDE